MTPAGTPLPSQVTSTGVRATLFSPVTSHRNLARFLLPEAWAITQWASKWRAALVGRSAPSPARRRRQGLPRLEVVTGSRESARSPAGWRAAPRAPGPGPLGLCCSRRRVSRPQLTQCGEPHCPEFPRGLRCDGLCYDTCRSTCPAWMPALIWLSICPWLLRCWCLVAVLCPTLLQPHRLSMAFPTQEYWSGLPFPSAGIEPTFPTLQGGFFTTELPRKPLQILHVLKSTLLLN